jgi:hypothetical protein
MLRVWVLSVSILSLAGAFISTLSRVAPMDKLVIGAVFHWYFIVPDSICSASSL